MKHIPIGAPIGLEIGQESNSMQLQIAGIVSGGASYDPGMMAFLASGPSYYNKTITTSGNKVTVVGRFNRASFTGGSLEYIFLINDSGNHRMQAILWSSDYTDATRRNKLQISVENSSGVKVCSLVSLTDFTDGADHTFMCSFDGDAGTAQFIVDGSNEDDTGHASRVAPTTGTLSASAATEASVAGTNSGASPLDGEIGFFGYREAYITNHGDFMSGANPIEIDESGWTEWGAQPLFWNQFGTMTDNKGSAGNMTANGTITGPA